MSSSAGPGWPATSRCSDPLLLELQRYRLWLVGRHVYRHGRAAGSSLVDRLLGVRTTPAEVTRLGEMSDASFSLRPCAWLTLWRTFRRLRVGGDDVLLDVGSGAGRAVLVARLFPFRRIIGLELSGPLHRQARANLTSFRRQGCSPVELVLGDAAACRVPDEVTVIFMYNPFGGHVFQRWLDQLLASLDRTPRRVRLAYVNPVEHERLMRTGRCRLVGRFSGLRPTSDWARMVSTHFYELR